MKIDSLLFPHPVLGRKDDVLGEFRLAEDGFSIQQDDRYTKLSIEFILKNKTLENLILKKEANFNVEVECPATFYRKSFLFTENKCEIDIEKNNLRSKVIVSFYITSDRKISRYKITGENQDYEDAEFDISEGDVLAFAGKTSFDAEVLWEDLRRIFNIIKIKNDTERDEGPAEFDLNGDIIYVFLSKNDYLSYDSFKDQNDSFTAIYHSSIVFPVLIYALTEMMSERKQEYMENKWFRVLDSRRTNDNEIGSLWDPKNIPDIVQKMLGEPFKRMLFSIEQLSTKSGGD